MPASPQFTTFGELLRSLRKRAGMTQRDLGQAVGYSEAHIARLEGGIRRPDVVVVKGAFVEALDLQHEPELAARLVSLAQAAHEQADHTDAGTPSNRQTVKYNLPAPATRLIGREREVAAITQQLCGDEARLITLIGSGGVGKTRLALEVAHRIGDQFSDGVWWVDLAPITEPQAVLMSIAQALEIVDHPGKPILRVLQDHLRDKRVLLVLDNLEQVLDAAPLIGQMLSIAREAKVLATSRELLRIAGEQGCIVNPLGDEAVELFARQAQAIKPDFTLTEANTEVIAEICRKLDGLPLAIELAAARITLFTPREMLSRLDQRLALLTLGSRDLPARQRTLRAAIDWSYRMLNPHEQALFRRLGVFAGSYSLHAVQALCNADALPLNAVDGLAALVAKSLLIRDEVINSQAGDSHASAMLGQAVGKAGHEAGSSAESHSRYRMLDTIREYAKELMLERGEYDRWVRVMAEYLLSIHAFVKHAFLDERENYMSAMQWLNASGDETGLALRLATQINAFSTSRDEQILCLEQAIRSTSVPQDSEQFIFAKAMHGIAIGNRGDRAQAVVILNEALKWYQTYGERADAIQGIFYALGLFNRDMGHTDLSRQYFMQSIAIARERGDQAELRHLDVTLAENEIAAEDAAAAGKLLDEAFAVPAPRDDSMLAWALNHRAHAAMLRDETTQAEFHLKESALLFSLASHQGAWGIAWNQQSLGEIGLAQGEAAQADSHFKLSLKMFDDAGDKMGISWCLFGLAGACALGKNASQGARLWGAGEALREKIGCRIAPASRKNRERTVAILKAQMGDAEFERLAAEGAAWTLEKAMEEALQTAPET